MAAMTHLGERLIQARRLRGTSQAELARRSGVSQPTISDLESGAQAGTKKAPELAHALKVDLNWLLTGRGEIEPRPGRRDDERHVFVARVEGAPVFTASGRIGWEHEEIDYSHGFQRSWLRERGLHPERCRTIRIRDDGMSPYLRDGDVVLVSLAHREIRSGEVYAIAVGEELRVKRIHRRADGGLDIISDNRSPQHPVEHVDVRSVERVSVIGQVMWRGG
jgi:phage repressor protein C with HTH and peptisase S24 domain